MNWQRLLTPRGSDRPRRDWNCQSRDEGVAPTINLQPLQGLHLMNLPQLLDAIQTEKYASQPLAAHRIAELNEHAREHYALLLAAVLRARASIGQSQSQVFSMLLKAMGLDGRQAALFEHVQAMTAQDLGECRRLIEEHGLARSFLLDAFVLLRLEGPPGDEDLRLCAELADLLQVDDKTLSTLVALALHILGVKTLPDFPEELSPRDCQHWHEFIWQEVTAAKLKAGLQPGLWLLRHAIEMDTGWSLENVTLSFAEGARLLTDTAADTIVTIKGSHLINPVMQFQNQSLTLNMQDCIVEGYYPEHAQLTAFSLNSMKNANFINTSFTTLNARTVHAIYTPIQLNQCQFVACGNRQLIGGALAIRTPEALSMEPMKMMGHFFESMVISGTSQHKGASRLDGDNLTVVVKLADCRFIHCVARLGGALRIDRLDYRSTNITNCLFDDCSATEPRLDYAVYADDIVTLQDQRFIQQTQFKRSSFYLGNRENLSGGDSYDHVFSELNLTDAKLHAKMRYESEFKEGVTLTGNSKIRTDVEHKLPNWTKDF